MRVKQGRNNPIAFGLRTHRRLLPVDLGQAKHRSDGHLH